MENHQLSASYFMQQREFMMDGPYVWCESMCEKGEPWLIKKFGSRESSGKLPSKQIQVIQGKLFCEASLAAGLHHTNLHLLRQVLFSNSRAHLVYEPCTHSLSDVQRKLSPLTAADSSYPTPTVKGLIFQLVSAVSHLYTSRVTHQGIRPQVVLMKGCLLRLGGLDSARVMHNHLPIRAAATAATSSGSIMPAAAATSSSSITQASLLTDFHTTFGSARTSPSNGRSTHKPLILNSGMGSSSLSSSSSVDCFITSSPYTAPEAILGDVVSSYPADIWSIGCITAELLTGQPLIAGSRDSDILWCIFKRQGLCRRHILIAQTRQDCQAFLKTTGDCNKPEGLHKRFSYLDEASTKFLQSCLDPDPNKRATAKDLLLSDFLKGVPDPELQDKLLNEHDRVHAVRNPGTQHELAVSVLALSEALSREGMNVEAAAEAAGIGHVLSDSRPVNAKRLIPSSPSAGMSLRYNPSLGPNHQACGFKKEKYYGDLPTTKNSAFVVKNDSTKLLVWEGDTSPSPAAPLGTASSKRRWGPVKRNVTMPESIMRAAAASGHPSNLVEGFSLSQKQQHNASRLIHTEGGDMDMITGSLKTEHVTSRISIPASSAAPAEEINRNHGFTMMMKEASILTPAPRPSPANEDLTIAGNVTQRGHQDLVKRRVGFTSAPPPHPLPKQTGRPRPYRSMTRPDLLRSRRAGGSYLISEPGSEQQCPGSTAHMMLSYDWLPGTAAAAPVVPEATTAFHMALNSSDSAAAAATALTSPGLAAITVKPGPCESSDTITVAETVDESVAWSSGPSFCSMLTAGSPSPQQISLKSADNSPSVLLKEQTNKGDNVDTSARGVSNVKQPRRRSVTIDPVAVVCTSHEDTAVHGADTVGIVIMGNQVENTKHQQEQQKQEEPTLQLLERVRRPALHRFSEAGTLLSEATGRGGAIAERAEGTVEVDRVERRCRQASPGPDNSPYATVEAALLGVDIGEPSELPLSLEQQAGCSDKNQARLYMVLTPVHQKELSGHEGLKISGHNAGSNEGGALKPLLVSQKGNVVTARAYEGGDEGTSSISNIARKVGWQATAPSGELTREVRSIYSARKSNQLIPAEYTPGPCLKMLELMLSNPDSVIMSPTKIKLCTK